MYFGKRIERVHIHWVKPWKTRRNLFDQGTSRGGLLVQLGTNRSMSWAAGAC